MTGHHVVVDEPRSLHQGVTHRRPHKRESVLAKLLRHLLRQWRDCRNVGVLLAVWLEWDSIHESPEKGVYTRVFTLELEKGVRIANHGIDFGPVADNTWVSDEACHIVGRVACHDMGLKVVADGDWTIKLEEIANAPHWDPSEKLSGYGDGVFIVNPRVSGFLKCIAKVRGDGYFAVWAYHGDEVTLLFSEIDGYTGENVFPVETHLVTVKSNNTSWSIELEDI